MKKILIMLIVLVTGTSIIKADQLAWLEKKDADKGAELIKKASIVYLFCGCCTNDPVTLAAVVEATVNYTGSESYYEITLEYVDQNGEYQSNAIDLAYVWISRGGTNITVGKLLGLKHDPCSDGKFKIPEQKTNANNSEWDGEFVYTSEDMFTSSYTLTINTIDAVTIAFLEVNGRGISFKMSCLVDILGNDIIIKYLDVIEGEYWEKENLDNQFAINSQFPELLRLEKKSAKIITTKWGMLSVPEETRAQNGRVLFTKIN